MINRIISFSIKNKFLIILFIIALIGWGTYSLSKLPIDAIPDITNNQVQVISIAPSLATQEVESFITAPIEVAVANIPGIIELRSISRLGLSVVTVVFEEQTDVYWARQQLTERLKEAEESIPEGLAQISLAPVSTGLGEIFQYRLAVEKGYEDIYNPMELRSIQDWIVRREMLGTKGVADINSYGGYVKEYEIAVNPERLRGMQLTLTDVFTALEKNNENTGSAYIDKKPNAYFIRGIGLVRSLEDIGKIVLKNNGKGIPVLIRDVADVRFGNATRYGAFVVDTTEAVGGVVMMLKGENAHQVIDNVKERIASIQKSLPSQVRIEPYLNRSDLVGRAINTVSRNLIEGALIVIFILVIMLGNMRAGLIVASVIPLSMLFAVSLMNLFGVSGNLMSLGAIDFGLIVDGAVIIVENVVHRISQGVRSNNNNNESGLTRAQMDETVLDSSKRMMSSATFGQIIILIVYLPVMALIGIEGKMFRPMAQVVTFALLGAAILSLTYVPVASSLFLSRKAKTGTAFSERLMTWFRRIFDPSVAFAIRNKIAITVTSVVLFILSLLLFSTMGGEFIPQLEEGDLAAGVMTLQGGSLTNTIDKVITANKILLENFPEVKHAVCKIGAGEIPTDPTPMETGDYIITLKDKDQWVSAESREELVAKMEEKLVTLAGVKFEFQQPIQMRFNELMSGSRQDIAVKIYGDDLNTLAEKAADVEKIIRNIKGVEDINVEQVTGLAQLQVEYNRDRLAQYGLSVNDLNFVLRSAFAGSQAGFVFDAEKRFGLVVRLDKDYRQNLDDIRNLSVSLPDGHQIPVGQVADISVKTGPAQVSREDTRRRITVGFNVRGRDIRSVIDDVSSQIDQKIKMPTGYYISYGGQFRNLEAAQKRLSIAVPVALLLIFVILYFTFNSIKQSLLIFSAVPMAAIGGILALWMRGMNFSISAGVGFIALFGVAVLNGIVLIAEFNRLEKEGISDIAQRVILGVHARLRPVIMTAAVASLGFLPMALSTSAGAEVQKPLATVVIGGLITATILTLVILPVFYILFSGKSKAGKTVKMMAITGLFACTSFLNEAKAQEPRLIKLDDAIKIALDSNLNVRSAAMSTDAKRALRGASLDLPKTDINGEYGQFNSYDNDNSFNVSQSFSLPSVYINRSRLAKADVRGSEFQYSIARLEAATSVKQVYWQYVYLAEKQKLLVYQDSLYSRFLRAASLRAKSGETNSLEMITARSQSFELKNRLFQVRADLQILSKKLRILLNTRELIIPDETGLHKIGFSPSADSLAIVNNPSLAYSMNEAEKARIEKKLERSQMLPDLNVGFFSQTIKGVEDVNGVPREFGPGDRFNGIQAGISIPVWIAPFAARSKAARLNEEAAKTNAEYSQKTISGNYSTLIDELKKYSSTIEYYENQANKEADLIINQAEKSYRAGELDYLDYVMTLNNALTIRESYIEALNNYNQTIISIEQVTGKIF